MTIIYSNNFDAETTGALPTGWANKVGTWVVSALQPVSPTKDFGSSSGGNGDVVLYTGSTAISTMGISTKLKQNYTGAAKPLIGHILCSDAANSNHYAVLFASTSTTGVSVLIFKKVAGAYSQIGTTTALTLAQAVGDVIYVRSTRNSSTGVINLYVGNGSLPGTPSLSITDTSLSAAGYPGLYNSTDAVTGYTMTIDDWQFDDAAGATSLTPGVGSIAITGYAPSVAQSGATVLTPGVGSIAITGYAPTIAQSGSGVVLVTDANWKFSPYNWDTNGTAKIAINGGAYFKLGFTGTSVSIGLDVSSLVAASVAAGWYPSLRYSVDNGPQTDVQLTSATTALAVTGLAGGTHVIGVFYVSGWWENIGGTAPDRWTTPSYCIKVTGATIDSSASTSAPAWSTDNSIWFGDSISEGIRANNSATQPGNQNGYESTPIYLARALNCEMGNVSFGGQGYASGFNTIPAFNSSYSLYSAGRSRLSGGVLVPSPGYVFIWQGANGGSTSANVQAAIGNMRTIAPSAKVCVLVPVGGFDQAPITAGVAAYLAANPNERRVYLIDLGASWQTGLNSFGSATEQGIDGLHPRSNWNARIASAYLQKIASLGSLTTATRTATITLTSDGTTPRASLTGLKWAFWDKATPDAMASPPADYGTGQTTNVSGVLSIAVRTSLAVAGVGWLVVTNSDGTTTQNPVAKAFSGPVAVA